MHSNLLSLVLSKKRGATLAAVRYVLSRLQPTLDPDHAMERFVSAATAVRGAVGAQCVHLCDVVQRILSLPHGRIDLSKRHVAFVTQVALQSLVLKDEFRTMIDLARTISTRPSTAVIPFQHADAAVKVVSVPSKSTKDDRKR